VQLHEASILFVSGHAVVMPDLLRSEAMIVGLSLLVRGFEYSRGWSSPGTKQAAPGRRFVQHTLLAPTCDLRALVGSSLTDDYGPALPLHPAPPVSPRFVNEIEVSVDSGSSTSTGRTS